MQELKMYKWVVGGGYVVLKLYGTCRMPKLKEVVVMQLFGGETYFFEEILGPSKYVSASMIYYPLYDVSNDIITAGKRTLIK